MQKMSEKPAFVCFIIGRAGKIRTQPSGGNFAPASSAIFGAGALEAGRVKFADNDENSAKCRLDDLRFGNGFSFAVIQALAQKFRCARTAVGGGLRKSERSPVENLFFVNCIARYIQGPPTGNLPL